MYPKVFINRISKLESEARMAKIGFTPFDLGSKIYDRMTVTGNI